jgi:hypothetical protein
MTKTKLDFKLGRHQTETIKRIAAASGMAMSEVICKALALLAVTLDERKKGNAICVTSGDKIVKDISLISTVEPAGDVSRRICRRRM